MITRDPSQTVSRPAEKEMPGGARAAAADPTGPRPALAHYRQVNLECARLITQRYSTSFSLGIRSLAPEYRPAIYSLYGFVRYADEIVDTFFAYDRAGLLDRFEQDTWEAIARGLSINPVLDAFAWMVNTYGIDHAHIRCFLTSMRMDLTETRYADQQAYQTYIDGSAEVVGLMCLMVFCQGDKARYDQLEPYARALGSAFQKINFLRDVGSDYHERGRVYFPDCDLEHLDEASRRAIEGDIAKDFEKGREGILLLPRGARMGVYLAYCYYYELFARIRALPLQDVLHRRVRVPDTYKGLLLARAWARHLIGAL